MALSKGAKSSALINNETVTYGSTSTLSNPAVDTTNAVRVGVEVVLTYGANTVPARLDVYGSMDDTNYTTAPIGSYPLVLAASSTTRQEFPVTDFPRYLKFKVANPEPTAISLTGVYVYAQNQVIS